MVQVLKGVQIKWLTMTKQAGKLVIAVCIGAKPEPRTRGQGRTIQRQAIEELRRWIVWRQHGCQDCRCHKQGDDAQAINGEPITPEPVPEIDHA